MPHNISHLSFLHNKKRNKRSSFRNGSSNWGSNQWSGLQHHLIFVTFVTWFAVLRHILALLSPCTAISRARLPLINSLLLQNHPTVNKIGCFNIVKQSKKESKRTLFLIGSPCPTQNQRPVRNKSRASYAPLAALLVSSEFAFPSSSTGRGQAHSS